MNSRTTHLFNFAGQFISALILALAVFQTNSFAGSSANPIRNPGVMQSVNPVAQGNGRVQPALSETTLALADEVTPELTNLAQALRNDPVLIEEWVLNNVEFEPYWGLRRGATMTYLDRFGNDWDQAALVVALLKAAGTNAHGDASYYSPTYKFGSVILTTAVASEQYNIAPTQILNTINSLALNSGDASDSNHIGVRRVWVNASLNGSTVVLDPSFKSYDAGSGSAYSIAAAGIGYSSTAAVTAAGGSLIGDGSGVQNMTPGTLRSDLTSWTTQAFSAASPVASASNLIGRHQILFQHLSALLSTLGSDEQVFSSYTFDMDSLDLCTEGLGFTIKIDQTTVTGPLCDFLGQKLAIWWGPGSQWTLYQGDTAISSGTASAGATSIPITFNFDAPVPFNTQGGYDDAGASNLTVGTPAVITYGSGAALGRLNESNRKIADYTVQLVASTDRTLVTEILHQIGLTYQNQRFAVSKVLTGLSGDYLAIDEFAGLVIDSSGGPSVDLPIAHVTVWSATDNWTNYDSAVGALSLWSSGLEKTVIDQVGPFGAFCATSALEAAMGASSNPIYLFQTSPSTGYTFNTDTANTANIDGIELTGLSEFNQTSIGNYLNSGSGGLLLIAKNSLPFSGSTPCGYLAWNLDGVIMSDTIGGGLHGAGSTLPGNFQITDAELSAQARSILKVYQPPLGGDPVDLSTGAFIQDTVDISFGQPEPKGLHLNRYYNSGMRANDTAGLGWGWTHSYIMQLTLRSAYDLDINHMSAADVMPIIVASQAMLDSFSVDSHSGTVKGWMTAVIAANWGSEQLVKNRVTITLGQREIEFAKLPNGTFVPESNVTASLRQDLGGYTLTFQNANIVHFPWNSGQLPTSFDTVTDQFLNALHATYSAGVLQTVTDCYSRTLTFHYAGGYLSSVAASFPSGSTPAPTVAYNVTVNQHTLTYTDPLSKNTTYTSDALGRILSVYDPISRPIVINTYDDWDRVQTQETAGLSTHMWNLGFAPGIATQVDPLNAVTCTYFNLQGHQVLTVDPLLQQNAWAYDAVDNLVSTVSGTGAQKQFTYDNNHNLTYEKNELGNSRQIEYDSLQRPYIVHSFENLLTTYAYKNSTSLVTSITAPGNVTTQYDYDGTGQLISYQPAHYSSAIQLKNFDSYGAATTLLYPNGLSDTLSHDSMGNLLSYVDRVGAKVTYTYNLKNQQTSQRRWYKANPTDTYLSAQAVDSTSYDAAGCVMGITVGATCSVDAGGTPGPVSGGRTTTYNFDQLQHLNTVKAGATPTVILTLGYNFSDQLTSATDALGDPTVPNPTHTTRLSRDGDYQVEGLTSAINQETLFTYNKDGYMDSISPPVDPQQTPITFSSVYRRNGELDSTTDGLTNTATYSDDKDSRLTGITNRRSNTYTWSYNDSLFTITQRTPSEQPSANGTVRTFDSRGLPTNTTLPSGKTYNFTQYDSEGHLTDYSDGVGAKHYDYYGNGLLWKVTDTPTGSTAKTSTRVYDELNRIKEYDDGTTATLYTYYADDQIATLTYPGGKVVTYQYDDFGRLQTVSDWLTRKTTYGYDLASRLTSINRPNSTKRVMSYYDDNRLDQIQEYLPNGSIFYFERITYDAKGNPTKIFTNPAKPSFAVPADAATFDNDNRLSTWSSPSASLTVTNDLNGYMTAGPLPNGTQGSYTYDARGRLLSAGAVSAYSYNADEYRTGVSDSAGSVSYSVSPLGRDSATLIRNGGTGDPTYYVYGLGLLYQDSGGSLTTYHYDHNGNTVGLVASNGQLTDTVAYSSFGSVIQPPSNTDTPFLFGGEAGVMTDSNGLYFMRARYYNSRIMRFISPDPSEFAGGMNWYSYANNNPLCFSDPLGLTPQPALSNSSNSGVTMMETMYVTANRVGGTWAGVGQVALGFGDAGKAFATDIEQVLGHPISSLVGIGSAVIHLPTTITAIKGGLQRTFSDLAGPDPRAVGRALGAIIINVATIEFPIGDVAEAANIAKVAEEGATLAAEEEAAALEAYGGPGGGHHVPAKSAFNGAAGYDANAALAIPNAELARLGVDHGLVTGAQQTLYRAVANSGQTLTWEMMQSIETQALIRGGMSPNMAATTVEKAINALKASGVTGPTRIPWGG